MPPKREGEERTWSDRRSARQGRRGRTREDPAVLDARGPCQRARRFEEPTSQARHLFDELVADPVGLSRAREVLDMIGKRADHRRLQSKAGQPKLCDERTVVVGFQSGERGDVGRHRPDHQAMLGPRAPAMV